MNWKVMTFTGTVRCNGEDVGTVTKTVNLEQYITRSMGEHNYENSLDQIIAQIADELTASLVVILDDDDCWEDLEDLYYAIVGEDE